MRRCPFPAASHGASAPASRSRAPAVLSSCCSVAARSRSTRATTASRTGSLPRRPPSLHHFAVSPSTHDDRTKTFVTSVSDVAGPMSTCSFDRARRTVNTVLSDPSEEVVPMATRGSAMRLLVIDGDEVLLALLRLALGGDGVEITTVCGGGSGLAAAEQYEPDLIVLDTVLPDLSGYEVLRRLRERADVPVIVLSGRDGHVDKVRAFELGADDYVTKPFSLPELEARVHAQLRRARRWMRREGVRRAYAYAA